MDQIKSCLAKIEAQLGWGQCASWSNYDFDQLSDAILDKTNVRLSNTTLKRVWGRIKYESAPTTATLNTLAQFAGYSDWRSFVKEQEVADVLVAEPILPPDVIGNGHVQVKKSYWSPSRVLVVLILLLIAGYLIYQKGFGSNSVRTADFTFEANKVIGEGVPNSVIFTYNATNAKTDSVFITQTWDIRRKTLVPRTQTKHSAIYYYPGYFRTHLIADGQVVRSHDLQITSNGWLGLVEMPDKPFYFQKSDIVKPDRVEIDDSLLRANNFDLKPVAPRIRFFNQGDLGDLMNDNFEMETTVRNAYRAGDNACQYVEVLIQCKDDIIIIPLVNAACVGEASLYIAGRGFQSKYADLSGFGADLSQWTTLKVTCQNRFMQLFVNNKKAFEFSFPNNATGIVGLQYRFNGAGAVKDTWFKNKEGKVIRM